MSLPVEMTKTGKPDSRWAGVMTLYAQGKYKCSTGQRPGDRRWRKRCGKHFTMFTTLYKVVNNVQQARDREAGDGGNDVENISQCSQPYGPMTFPDI